MPKDISKMSVDDIRKELDSLQASAPDKDDVALEFQMDAPAKPEDLSIFEAMKNLPGGDVTDEQAADIIQLLMEGTGAGIGGVAGGPPGAVGGAIGMEKLFELGQIEGILPGEPPQSLGESVGETAMTGGAVATGEGIGGVIGKLLSGRGPFKGAVSQSAKEAQKLIGPNTQIPPAQMSESTFVEVVQNILKNALGSAGRITAAEQGAKDAAEAGIRRFVNKFTSNVGNLPRQKRLGIISNALNRRQTEFDTLVLGSARELDGIFKGVPKINLRKVAPGGPKGAPREPLLVGKDVITFSKAVQLLRNPRISDVTKKALKKEMKRTAKNLDDAIESSGASAFNPEMGGMFQRNVNQILEQLPRFKDFNSRMLKNLTAANPKDVVTLLMKPRNEAQIEAARKAIDDVDTWRLVEFEVLENLVRMSTTQGRAENVASLKALNLSNFIEKDLTNETFKAFFQKPSQNFSTFNKWLNANKIAQKDPQSKLGSMLVQMKQATATTQVIAALASPALLGAPGMAFSIALLGGPPILAKIFTNRKVVEFLTTGTTVKATTKERIRFYSDLLALLKKQGFDVAEGPPVDAPESTFAPFGERGLAGSLMQELSTIGE